jgi:gluconolactonase
MEPITMHRLHARFDRLPSPSHRMHVLTGLLLVGSCLASSSLPSPSPLAAQETTTQETTTQETTAEDPAVQQSAAEQVTADGATVETVAAQYEFTEGPAVDADGNVYFTDQPNNRIMKWDHKTDKITEFLKPAGRSNGLYFAPSGELIACADENNELWSIGEDGHHQVLVATYRGKRLNGPNDVWVHQDGTIYFTDPLYQRPWWKHEGDQQDQRGVYRLSADRKTLTRVATDFKQPNGIVGDSDRGLLFVADIDDSKVYRFRIDASGNLGERSVFCEHESDGMTIDREGRIYLTSSHGVSVYDRDGKEVQTITVPQPWTANACFGGANRDILFITASKGLYRIQTTTQGLPSP